MPRAALSVVPDPAPDDLVRFYDVTSADGTRLRAWTNDLDGTRAASPTTPTVLLCNGLGTSPYTWPALLDPQCGVRVISWNHRGVGGSDCPADPARCGIDAFVEDALAVMDDAGIDACPLMGWSMGVNTAFELAYLHPERVTGLFAVAGVPGGTFSSMLAPMFVPRPLRPLITVNAARAMKLAGKPLSVVARNLPVGPVTGEVITHSGFMLPTPDLAMTRRAVKEFLTTPIDWYMHLALATAKHVRVSLRNVRVPTTFVAGRYDVLASSADMRTAADRIEGAVYVELKGTHFVAMERPAEVHDLLLDLLDRVG
ncbi:alpha/beta fold hydrolase [Nocardioides terrisoli]|uniref:alpha/beta fold hydrolase n=1 Tax=Nocardioides terrisoli TaxID=3388267 RepID=UPI00287B69D1|nr:alpha/beta hydrolase [Nocardioides marmorisolisilvae]